MVFRNWMDIGRDRSGSVSGGFDYRRQSDWGKVPDIVTLQCIPSPLIHDALCVKTFRLAFRKKSNSHRHDMIVTLI